MKILLHAFSLILIVFIASCNGVESEPLKQHLSASFNLEDSILLADTIDIEQFLLEFNQADSVIYSPTAVREFGFEIVTIHQGRNNIGIVDNYFSDAFIYDDKISIKNLKVGNSKEKILSTLKDISIENDSTLMYQYPLKDIYLTFILREDTVKHMIFHALGYFY